MVGRGRERTEEGMSAVAGDGKGKEKRKWRRYWLVGVPRGQRNMAGTRNQNKLLQQRKQRNKITYTKKENEKKTATR